MLYITMTATVVVEPKSFFSFMTKMADPVYSMSNEESKSTTELTFLSRQWQASHEPPLFSLWMASSEVDQKFLGHFAKTTGEANAYLSSMVCV
jgi:hypothetical protein